MRPSKGLPTSQPNPPQQVEAATVGNCDLKRRLKKKEEKKREKVRIFVPTSQPNPPQQVEAATVGDRDQDLNLPYNAQQLFKSFRKQKNQY